MAKLQPVRGTHDLLPEAARRHRNVVDRFRAVAEVYGYGEIQTPVFEFTGVFSRTLGDTSDVVTKEMYSFSDRGGDEITLRPENTASVVRAVLSNGLLQSLPLRFHYAGPMFRYERPQKGRQRQFHQIGVELFGVAEPEGDVEVIALAADVLDRLGILGETRLELSTLGDDESREAYRSALVDYLKGHRDRLSEESRERLARNPLRVLDSKDRGDREVVAGAPVVFDHLSPAAADFFGTVKAGLDDLGIGYVLNPAIVRGLDYYCHTAFEFVTESLGAQGTVIGGGRYDRLVEQMGGPPTPGVGWAGGIERLALLAGEGEPAQRPVAIVPLGDAAARRAAPLARELRRDGIAVDLGYRGSLKKRMARANRIDACAALILGDDELARGTVTLRDLDSGEQSEIPLDGVGEALRRFR